MSKTSRRAYLIPYIVIILLIAVPFLFMGTLESFLGMYYLGVPGIGVLLLVILEISLRVRYELFVKERTVTERRGVLSKHERTVDYDDITSTAVSQGLLARVLGYGELIVNIKAAPEPLKFSKMGNPNRVKRLIEEQIRRTAPARGQYPPAPPAPAYRPPAEGVR